MGGLHHVEKIDIRACHAPVFVDEGEGEGFLLVLRQFGEMLKELVVVAADWAERDPAARGQGASYGRWIGGGRGRHGQPLAPAGSETQ